MLVCCSVLAHHSVSMIDVSIPVWVKGTVVRYENGNPHVVLELVKSESGRLEPWTIEGPIPGRLARILAVNGMTSDAELLKVGDVIEVCGFHPKRSIADQGTSPSTEVRSSTYIHGHVLVMPDGRMQSWGPYGKLDNCIRSSDRPQAWLDFLHSDPLALEFWCNIRGFVGVVSTAPKGFVDEINRVLSDPCLPR